MRAEPPNLEFEQALWQQGISHVAGIDEAGRGAWAGPVAAAVVILPANQAIVDRLHGVTDSKLLTPARRSVFAPLIKESALAWGLGMADHHEIDELGILPATRLAVLRALQAMQLAAGHLLIDALFLPDCEIPQTALIKGDRRSLSIASASILAKTSRDAWMIAAHENYPQYGFARHKGYGTALHRQNLEEHGCCEIHRRSYKPIQQSGR